MLVCLKKCRKCLVRGFISIKTSIILSCGFHLSWINLKNITSVINMGPREKKILTEELKKEEELGSER